MSSKSYFKSNKNQNSRNNANPTYTQYRVIKIILIKIELVPKFFNRL